MYRRSRAREVALQVLCQRDANRVEDLAWIAAFIDERLREPRTRDYSRKLIDGFGTRGPQVDQLLASAATNWRLPRMATVDRNVLRLGVLELLLGDPEVPPAVVLNEAIELARRYGSAESPAFVNGILDRVRQSLAQPE